MLNIHIQRFFESEKNTYGIFTNGFLTNKNESDLWKESVFCLLIFMHLFMSRRETNGEKPWSEKVEIVSIRTEIESLIDYYKTSSNFFILSLIFWTTIYLLYEILICYWIVHVSNILTVDFGSMKVSYKYVFVFFMYYFHVLLQAFIDIVCMFFDTAAAR